MIGFNGGEALGGWWWWRWCQDNDNKKRTHARTHSLAQLTTLTHTARQATLSGSSGSGPGCCRSKRPELPAGLALALSADLHPSPISHFLACDQHMMIMILTGSLQHPIP